MLNQRLSTAAAFFAASSFLWVSGCAAPPPSSQEAAGHSDEGEGGHGGEPKFLYTGDHGPGFWGTLSADWEACAVDPRQSPIDLTDPVVDSDLGPLDLEIQETGLDLANNGHTLQQAYAGGGTLRFEGVDYTLQQFHFHTLSEHAVDGQRGVMELHAVFSNSETQTNAVVGVMYHLGEEDPFLAQFDGRLPKATGEVVQDEAVRLNLSRGLTDTASYSTYPGSLTTPPCSPTVTWIVLGQPRELSPGQLGAFRDIMGNNFRPLQERGERTLRTTAPPAAGA